MKNPGFQSSLVWFAFAMLIAFSGALRAEPPPSSPEVQSSKAPPGKRIKPQIIYHVRPSSNYAATLHSQEKSRNRDFPIDEERPASAQSSRPNAEASAQQEAAVRQRSVKRPKMQRNHSQRPQFSVKPKSHGNKGHKH